jgi:hypothetical protein
MKHRISVGVIVEEAASTSSPAHSRTSKSSSTPRLATSSSGSSVRREAARGCALRVDQPEAAGELITEAAWLSRPELEQRIVFPPVLVDRYWHDRVAGFAAPVLLPLRRMDFW